MYIACIKLLQHKYLLLQHEYFSTHPQAMIFHVCICNLYMIRNFINRSNLITLVHSLIVLKVDYCNSLFVGLPNVTLKKVQSILNRVARLIFSLSPRVPITPYLIDLHWLPVKA